MRIPCPQKLPAIEGQLYVPVSKWGKRMQRGTELRMKAPSLRTGVANFAVICANHKKSAVCHCWYCQRQECHWVAKTTFLQFQGNTQISYLMTENVVRGEAESAASCKKPQLYTAVALLTHAQRPVAGKKRSRTSWEEPSPFLPIGRMVRIRMSRKARIDRPLNIRIQSSSSSRNLRWGR
jgi:hypothetical protein